MEWLIDNQSNLSKINNNKMIVLIRNELESVAFIEEEFLNKKIQKKEDFFEDLTKKFMRGRQYEAAWTMHVDACEGYQMIEKFAHNI